MAILGAEPAVFDAYDRGIATEYRGTVPAWLFRLNRRRFLKALLGKPRIYLSDFFHERLDARARANLRRAINAKRSEEHTSELQSLMRNSYAVFCSKKKNNYTQL